MTASTEDTLSRSHRRPGHGYEFRVFDSIDEVPDRDWRQVCRSSSADGLLEPAFIRSVEAGMKLFSRFRHVIVYSRENEPVACASLSVMQVEIADMLSPRIAEIIRSAPLIARHLRLKLVLCGLPISLGQKSLAYVASCDLREVFQGLEKVASELSRHEAAHIIAYKELEDSELLSADELLRQGHFCFDLPPMNLFEGAFSSFDDYCRALKSHYRTKIRHSMRKLANAGAQVRLLTDREEILSLYTEEVHRLYLAVVGKAEFKLEVLPIEFFQELVRQFPQTVELVVIERQGVILAFNWALRTQRAYHFLFAGVDYQWNRELDLYFNLMCAALSVGLRTGSGHIEVGQSADAFKARLGCTQRRLYVFARGCNWFTAGLLRYGRRLFLPLRAAPKFDIFKSGIGIGDK